MTLSYLQKGQLAECHVFWGVSFLAKVREIKGDLNTFVGRKQHPVNMQLADLDITGLPSVAEIR